MLYKFPQNSVLLKHDIFCQKHASSIEIYQLQGKATVVCSISFDTVLKIPPYPAITPTYAKLHEIEQTFIYINHKPVKMLQTHTTQIYKMNEWNDDYKSCLLVKTCPLISINHSTFLYV